jgi:cobalt/nickel transport system permease protein
MHIPDGYLSPQTTIPVLAGMVPVWAVALRKVKKTLSAKRIPTLALCAAFSFVIMMFNVPVIGGSSAHAVGAVFIAILLGPWAATISVSTALLIQALVFGDGGILTFGVNCLNMAVIMPFAGYYIYKLIAGNSKLGSSRGLAGRI